MEKMENLKWRNVLYGFCRWNCSCYLASLPFVGETRNVNKVFVPFRNVTFKKRSIEKALNPEWRKFL
jgi:hypothetical protein